MQISLIGMMASGKTTIAKLLSQKLSLNFIDLDEQISVQENLTINQIFAKKGEIYFRKIEEDLLEKIINTQKDYILSCGGGIILSKKNRDLLKQKTQSIWLDVGSETLYKRLQKENYRPLLKKLSYKKIDDILQTRIDFYKIADITIKAESEDTEFILNNIINKLSKHNV